VKNSQLSSEGQADNSGIKISSNMLRGDKTELSQGCNLAKRIQLI